MDRWSVHPPVPEAFELSKELRVHAEVLSILMRRGLRAASEISAFLNPSIQTLGRPESFPGVAQAAARIQKAIERKEKILVYGDYDVDGVTATSILTPVLIGLGADAQAHLPHRIHEGYGLNIESLREHLKRGVKLVITVDNGITSFDAVKFLKDSRADVIIVDHHLPKGEMPPADIIVSAASSPDTPGADLAACGLAFKLAWALAGDYAKVEHCLDLVTLGTIADLAPVEGENRVLLHLGMPRLAGTKRPGLRALMREAGIHPNYLSYRDIAFGLGPRINAAGRMGSPMDAYKLLTTSNETEAANLAKILEAGNRERQRVENDAYQEAVRLVEESYPDKAKRHVLVVGHEEWHEGVLGIVAARLVDRFRRPAVAISFRSDPGKGSGRSIPGFSIHGHIRHSEDLLEAFGGHSQACGLSIRGSKFEAFRRKLNEASPDGALAEGEDTLWIDAEIPPARLDAAFLKDLQKLEPFGPGNPRPLFSSKSMRMRGEPKKRGKDTLQCWLTDAEGKVTCEAILFRGYERWSKEMKSRRDFEIAYQPALKNTNGILSIELQIERWR